MSAYLRVAIALVDAMREARDEPDREDVAALADYLHACAAQAGTPLKRHARGTEGIPRTLLEAS